MSYADKDIPNGLTKADDDHIAIAWADGREFRYKMDVLRARCPCAGCVDEFTGVVKVKFEDVQGVGIKKVEQVGTYAFSILFADGHQTGIFPFKRLREWGELGMGETMSPPQG